MGAACEAVGTRAHLGDVSTELSNAWGLEPMLSVSDLADYLGVPVSTVYDWRSNGLGPVGHRLGKHIRFALSDVRTWLESQRETVVGIRHHRGPNGSDDSAQPTSAWMGLGGDGR